jgi:hypothetical protein
LGAAQLSTQEKPIPADPLQTGVDPAQLIPQVPQVAAVDRSVSQPFVASMSQLPKPGSHRKPQAPMVQVAELFAGAAGQTVPHVPQFEVDEATSVSQPVAASPSQSPKPMSQPTRVQVPVAQLCIALGNSQSAPHPPQFVRVTVDVSHPVSLAASQSAKFGSQDMPQVPPAHAGAA